ncbi:MAG: SMC-Scp complex subunit ScpB [Devosiaceae bacterium]|nr:SMC-Scp complex subunit ScpB [Devosiaceae bacterium MH13]
MSDSGDTTPSRQDSEEPTGSVGEAPQLSLVTPDGEQVPAVEEAPQAADKRVLPDVSPEDAIRIVEAILFASESAVSLATLETYAGAHAQDALSALEERYQTGGVTLMAVAGGYALRTAEDLEWLFEEQAREPRKLSRAALETLAIIAYHQPVTRAEIEEIRGVAASKGTLDVLLETGWVRMRGRRRTPGRPVTYGTTPSFLDHFTLGSIGDLPGLDELRGAGLLDVSDTSAPMLPGLNPSADPADEDPIDEEDAEAERAAMALWPADEAQDGEAAQDGAETEPAPDGAETEPAPDGSERS